MKLTALFLLGVLPLVVLSVVPYKNQLDLSTDLQYAGGKYIYGLAPNGTVYQSVDEGRSYQLLPNVAHILSIYVGNTDGVVFLLGSFETNTSYWVDQGFVSTVRLGRYFNQVKLHPTNQKMLLASDRRGGVDYFDLYSTTDATSPNPTMTVVRTKVYDYYHCFAGFAPNPEGRICAISDVPRSGPQRLVVSQDLGKTWDTRINHLITTFTEHWSFIFAVDIEARLWVSSDNATTFKFAQFPEDARIYRIQAEQILSARSGAVFIGGYPGVDDWGTPRDGNIYVSDTSGTQYTLVGDHINSLNNWWDFATVHELEGFYIANYLEGWENDKYVGPNGEVKMRTVMTYDNAANWSYIQAPPGTGCDGKSILGCSLNLYGRTTWLGVGGGGFFGDVYSSWNAPGTIIGTGNAGPYLNNTRESTHTFISHDGGYNWTVLFPHPTIYAINPTYGIMVFVENQVPITSIAYFLDGKEVQYLTLDGGKEHICTSLYNPEWSRTFILKCHDFTYFVIDFDNENTNPCVESDIQTFVPDNNVCILGRTTIYQRRAIGSHCALPTGFKSIKSATPCPCTLARDYECDLGYERVSYTSPVCRLFNPDQYDPTQNSELCWGGKSSYEVSSGYRKISGDTCNTVIPNVQPTTKACPASNTPITLPGGMSVGGVVALMLFFMLIVALGAFVGGIIAGHKSHHIRERVPKSWISVESHRLI